MSMINAAFYRGDKTFAVEQREAAAPAAGEVPVRIAYCGICGTYMHVYHGNMDARVGLNRVVGHEMSAVVEADAEGFTEGKKWSCVRLITVAIVRLVTLATSTFVIT